MPRNKKEKTVSFRIKKHLFDFLDEYTANKDYDKTYLMTKLLENFYLESQRGKNTDRLVEQQPLTILMDKKLKSFLKQFADENNLNMEDMAVAVIEYFFMGFLSNQFTKSYEEMKNDFMSQKTNKKAEVKI